MKILTGIFMIFMDLFMIVLFFIALIIALIVLDYLLDSNLKDELNRVLGPRQRLQDIRKRVLGFIKKVDELDYEEEKKKQQIDIHDDSWYDFDLRRNVNKES